MGSGCFKIPTLTSLVRSSVFLGLWAVSLASLGSAPQPAADVSLEEQRKLYLDAQQALRANDNLHFQALLKKLDDYPLRPYLEYAQLKQRFHKLPRKDVESFLKVYQGTAVAAKAYNDWLRTLYNKQAWKLLTDHYQAHKSNTTQHCYYLRALIETGNKEHAYAQIPELWTVPYSQPKACDKPFEKWIADEQLTDDLIWDRHLAALNNKKYSLATYLRKLMSPAIQGDIKLLMEVRRNPKLLAEHRRFEPLSARKVEILSEGLTRLARINAEQAYHLWQHYQAATLFDDQDHQEIQSAILLRLAKEGNKALVSNMLEQSPVLNKQKFLEWQIRDALGRLDWPEIYSGIVQLPPEVRTSDRWQYWYARAVEILSPDNRLTQKSEEIYTRLSQERSYYGFLSADRLGLNYQLTHNPIDPNDKLSLSLQERPAFQRSREFFMLSMKGDAYREWRYATRKLDTNQLAAAGKLAQQWGWYILSIQSLAAAKVWDDLQLRFPLAYTENFISAASKTRADASFLMAIARSESAFREDARSPVGALGLMQLMPATAKATARKVGVRYNKKSLLQAPVNIKLGSQYFNELLEKFNGNRILATAAYNAGPHRVNRWLNDAAPLPFDAWIETIPFKETRHYVQRVLSYAVIYSHRLGTPNNLITSEESNQLL